MEFDKIQIAKLLWNDTERRRAKTTTHILRTTWLSALPTNSNLPSSQIPKAYFGMVMVTTIWLSVSRRSETAGMPESWILARD